MFSVVADTAGGSSKHTVSEPDEKIDELIWRPEMAIPEEKMSAYEGYCYQGAGVLMLVGFW